MTQASTADQRHLQQPLADLEGRLPAERPLQPLGRREAAEVGLDGPQRQQAAGLQHPQRPAPARRPRASGAARTRASTLVPASSAAAGRAARRRRRQRAAPVGEQAGDALRPARDERQQRRRHRRRRDQVAAVGDLSPPARLVEALLGRLLGRLPGCGHAIASS